MEVSEYAARVAALLDDNSMDRERTWDDFWVRQ